VFKFVLVWVLVFVGGFCIWLVCRARLALIYDWESPGLFYSEYSETLLAKNQANLHVGLNSDQAETIKSRAKAALIKAPLNDKVFSQIALSQFLKNQKFSRQDLFIEAQHRNKRNRNALKSLVALGLEKNDILAVVSNSSALIQLDGSKEASLYLDMINRLSEDPEGREIVNVYLQKRPVWAPSMLRKKISQMSIGNISEVQKALSSYCLIRNNFSVDRELHERFINKLVELRAYNQAFSYWKRNLPEGENANSLIRDSNFRGSAALLPFNWRFITGPKFSGEVHSLEGLYAFYNDSRQRILVEQTLKLHSDQSYQLRIDAEWDYQQGQGMFAWQLQCLPQKTIIMDVSMGNETRNKGNISREFYVPPEHCDMQRLQLVGVPSQYSKRIDALVRSVDITTSEP